MKREVNRSNNTWWGKGSGVGLEEVWGKGSGSRVRGSKVSKGAPGREAIKSNFLLLLLLLLLLLRL